VCENWFFLYQYNFTNYFHLGQLGGPEALSLVTTWPEHKAEKSLPSNGEE